MDYDEDFLIWKDSENAWFRQEKWMWLLLVFCFPFGCYIMFKYHHDEISDMNKIGYSFAFCIIWLSGLGMVVKSFPSIPSAEPERSYYYTEPEATTTTRITKATLPTRERQTTTEATTTTTTTTSAATTTATTTTTTETTTTTTTETVRYVYTYSATTYTVISRDYYVNTKSWIYHSTRCRTIPDNMGEHWVYYTGTSEDLKNMGYTPCGTCKPY